MTGDASGSVDGNRPFSATAPRLCKGLVESQELVAASFCFETGWPPAGCERKAKGCAINPLGREAAQHQRASF